MGGTFIEASVERYATLCDNYAGQYQIVCMNEFVGIPGSGYRAVEKITDTRLTFSLDIDGLDYRVLGTIRMRPKVIALEGGFAWHPEFKTRVPDEIAACNLQQPLPIMIEMQRRPVISRFASIRTFTLCATIWPSHLPTFRPMH